MVGAAGRVAALVVPALVARGVTVVGMVRAAPGREIARRRGAQETTFADLRDPASLRAAMTDVEGVFHLNPAFDPHEAEMGTNMVEAARRAGVSKFVFSSVFHPSLNALSNHAAKQPVEEALYDSGLDFTILQPAMFMQNFDDTWSDIVSTGRLTMPFSKEAKVCYVDYRDVATVAARAMTDPLLHHATYELCSEGMVDRIQLAALASAACGREIRAEGSTPQRWADSSSMPAGPLRDGLTRMYEHYDRAGFAGGNSFVLHALLGRAPTTIADYFRHLAARNQPQEDRP